MRMGLEFKPLNMNMNLNSVPGLQNSINTNEIFSQFASELQNQPDQLASLKNFVTESYPELAINNNPNSVLNDKNAILNQLNMSKGLNKTAGIAEPTTTQSHSMFSRANSHPNPTTATTHTPKIMCNRMTQTHLVIQIQMS